LTNLKVIAAHLLLSHGMLVDAGEQQQHSLHDAESLLQSCGSQLRPAAPEKPLTPILDDPYYVLFRPGLGTRSVARNLHMPVALRGKRSLQGTQP
jgi:hypothetical protein